ncbi:MAG TPA: DUF488 domain-containing protein [Caulobacteraceae bacterium]|nr:DUF488 domain-containing protein [Caulobacteraceae bacterium]
MPAVSTIGYERATLAEVIDRLRRGGVDIVLDVRAVAASRRPGFSKTILAASLEDAGIAYRHLRTLGTPKSGREAARAGKTWLMREIFTAHLEEPAAQAGLAEAADIAASRPAALLCYEAEAAKCHRAIVALRIQSANGGDIIDL